MQWPARWPPSCLHSAAARSTPRRDGKFTFVNVLFDTDGQLLCTLGGDTLTAYRTPATCALAIRALAVDGGSSVTTAALVGAGRQSLKHLEMLAAELPALAEIRVADINPDALAAVVASANAAGIPATCAKDAASAVHGAEVIVTVTQSTVAAVPGRRGGRRRADLRGRLHEVRPLRDRRRCGGPLLGGGVRRRRR